MPVEVDPSQVQPIEVDASQVSAMPGGQSSEPGGLKQFIQHWGGQISGTAESLLHPINTMIALHKDTADELGQAKEKLDKKDYAGAAVHLGNAMPVIGPMIRQLSGELATKDEQGNPKAMEFGAAMGDVAGWLTLGKLAEAAPELPGAVKDTTTATMQAAAKIKPKTAGAIGKTLGGAAGGTIGHTFAGPVGAGAGAIIGAEAGETLARSLLDQIKSKVRRAVPTEKPSASTIVKPDELSSSPRPDWRQAEVDRLNPEPLPTQASGPVHDYASRNSTLADVLQNPEAPVQTTAGAQQPPPAPQQAAAATPQAAGGTPTPQRPVENAPVRAESATESNPFEAAKRDIKSKALAQFLFRDGEGLTPADARKMSPADWQTAARGAVAMAQDIEKAGGAKNPWPKGMPEPSPKAVQMAIDELARLHRTGPIAQQLAAEMNK